jgi:sialidase-1
MMAALCLAAEAPAAEPLFEQTIVFRGGEDGYHTYRLPTLVVSKKGTLFVFCDGRKHHAGDIGKIDPVLKRSTDGGRTWLPMQVLATDPAPKAKLGNGCPIADLRTGAVHFLYCHDLTRAFRLTTRDEGVTFERAEITDAFKAFPYKWAYFATGHVHGIQLRDGRLVAPVWLNDVPRRSEAKGRMRVGILASADGGATWRPGGLVPATFPRLNESSVFECADGSLCLNMRTMGRGCRAVSRSTDGGATWTEPALDKALPCPTCQASTLVLPSADGAHRVLFANPATRKSRTRLTVRLSTDGGRTWPVARQITAGRSGYCDLAAAPDGTIYLAYESGGKRYAETITLARFNLAWLTGGKSAGGH